MKQLVICAVALVAVALTACQDKKDNGKLDPEAKVYISPAQGVKADTENPKHLTARQIVEQANALTGVNFGIMGVDDWNRDLERNRIIGVSTWVVAQDGTLETGLIKARDMILVTLDYGNIPRDTIAYLPNAVMIEAEKKIRAAYDVENYEACYKLFEEAFVFYPITGAEWLALKAAGNN